MKVRLQMLYHAAFVMILALVGSSSAAAAGYTGGVPWQTGDIVACSGAGTCSVLRIVTINGTPTPMLLDQFSDGVGGNNTGVAINNTLHVVTTDDAGGGSSKVLVSPIASLNPNIATSPQNFVPHTPPVYTYDTSVNNTSSQIKAVAYDNAGDIFVLNSAATGGHPNIVKLGPGPTQSNATTTSFSLSACGITQATSMDLSAGPDQSGFLHAYVTSGGTVQNVTLSTATAPCAKFADFGTGVTLYGIKDIPSGALASVGTCKGPACPSDESLLVVATGFTDPDAAEGTELSSDPDAYNICTNAQDQNPVSCALLIDTDPTKATLSAPLWTAGRVYPGVGNLTTILDPQLKLQSVFTAGTSGADEPKFDENGGTVIDNAVKWTDIQQPGWLMNHAYAKGALPAHTVAAVSDTFFVDPNGNLETVTTPGMSGPVEPGAVGNPVSWSASPLVPTIDGLQWQDKGGWLAGHLYSTLGQPVGDTSFHIHKVLTGGTAGLGPSTPTGGWNEGGITIDNAVIWTNQGAFSAYAASTVFGLGAYTAPNNTRVQQAIQPGKSGSSTLFVTSTGTKTEDGGVTWTDQGQRPWHPSFAFTSSAVIVDAAGHLQQVTTAGTSGPVQPTFNDSGSTTTDGLQWTDQGPPATWAPTTAFTAGQLIVDNSSPNLHVQQVVGPGMTGTTEGPFNTSGGYTTDGSVVWLDRGLATYQPTHAYNVGDAFSDGTDIQQALTAGTSGGSAPSFTHTPGAVTPDNAAVWTDEGVLAWAGNTAYDDSTAAKTFVVDGTNHVQKAAIAGTSSTSGPPAFVDGGLTLNDGAVTWQDQGVPLWHPAAYALNIVVIDAAGHLQQVTTAGTSGPVQPTFNDSGSTTTDGLQWTDQGSPANWAGTTAFTAGQLIVDNSSPNPHVQQVVGAGTTGSSEGPFNTSGGYTTDGSVVWLDRGLAGYQSAHAYNVGDAFSDGTDIQQAVTAGTSGGSAPSFTDTPGITPDNVVIWTDEGTSPWQNNHIYAANSFIIDSAGHVQETTAGGKSGNNPPTFNDDNLAAEGVYDGLLWQDIGPLLTWSANTPFTASAVAPFTLVVGNNFLQEATTTGASGTSTPTWNSVVGKMTVDGLQWTDEGVMQRQPGQLYSNPTLVSDPAGHAQSLYEAGTAGSGATPAGGWKDDGTNTIDNAAIWTESDPTRQTSQPYVLGAIVLNTPGTAGAHVEQVSLAGTTGPGAMAMAFSTSGGTVIDGLQWQNQTSPPVAVAARYPVTSATPTLTSLALDPLIADCTSGCSYPLTTLRTSNFWLGDSQSGKVYKLDFATGGGGTPPSFDLDAARSAVCAGCSAITVQGLGIYGSEGANQPGLAKLLFNSNAAPSNTQVAYFPSSTNAGKNSLTITLYNGATAAPSLVPFAVYASAINPTSCYTDQTPGHSPCTLTFPTNTNAGNVPLVWKNDIPLPSSGSLSLLSTQTLAGNFEFPVGNSFSNDVALDAFYDTTTSVGTDSPTFTKPSTAMVYSVNNPSGNGGKEFDYGCSYSSPIISPSHSCFANPGTIPIKFSCTGLTGNQLQNFGFSSTTKWGPTLEITQYGKPPIPAPGSPMTPAPFPTGSAPSETNGNKLAGTTLNLAPELAATQLQSSNSGITYTMKNSNWTYNWVVTSTIQGQVYKICTYDQSNGSWNTNGKAKPFCTAFFSVKNSCP